MEFPTHLNNENSLEHWITFLFHSVIYTVMCHWYICHLFLLYLLSGTVEYCVLFFFHKIYIIFCVLVWSTGCVLSLYWFLVVFIMLIYQNTASCTTPQSRGKSFYLRCTNSEKMKVLDLKLNQNSSCLGRISKYEDPSSLKIFQTPTC